MGYWVASRSCSDCTDIATTVGCYRKTVGALKITQKALKPERTQTMLFRASKISRIGPIVANLYWFENSWFTHGILITHSPPLSPNRRALSQNSRPLSHTSIKIIKYTIRPAQNIQNFKNRPNSRKVMMVWKNCHFFYVKLAKIDDFRGDLRSDDDNYIALFFLIEGFTVIVVYIHPPRFVAQISDCLKKL